MSYQEESQWVHEDGYGSPAFGGIIIGLLQLALGLLLGIIWIITSITALWKKKI